MQIFILHKYSENLQLSLTHSRAESTWQLFIIWQDCWWRLYCNCNLHKSNIYNFILFLDSIVHYYYLLRIFYSITNLSKLTIYEFLSIDVILLEYTLAPLYKIGFYLDTSNQTLFSNPYSRLSNYAIKQSMQHIMITCLIETNVCAMC